jgi:hypothetical protein
MFANRSFAFGLTLGALAVSQANNAGAQKREPNETEKALAAQIKCEDFAKNSNGGWTSGPNVRIGATDLGGNTFGVRGVNVNGADLATVLNQKCGEQRP